MNTLDMAARFCTDGRAVSAETYGSGHINETYLVTTDRGVRYIFQRLNSTVFKNPAQVMENIIGVTEYLRRQGNDRMLQLMDTKDGQKYILSSDGMLYRMYNYIENAVSLDQPETDMDFYQSGVAFGRFQAQLRDYPADSLHEVIPDFHNTPVRYRDFRRAVEQDAVGRAKTVAAEIAYIHSRSDFYGLLEDQHKAGRLPLKVTHNDTKLNNVMLDAVTREPVCVVDLDTVMPGYAVTDFGDSIRFGASSAVEDEVNLDKVHFLPERYKTYAQGFLRGCDGALSESELSLLGAGAEMMTLECGMRFLADYLAGDVYFKTAYPEHNLVRCRTQLKLAAEMEKSRRQMQEIIEEIVG